MSSDRFAFLVAVAMFAAGLLGLVLQRVLPEHHTTGGSRDMIGAVVGLLTLLCALVRPSRLDGLRRVLEPECADPGSRGEGHAARPRARRLWAGRDPGARADPGLAGPDHRPNLAREPERRQC